MHIDGATERYALLGEKLPHTHSPFIHNSLFAAYGRNAVYIPLPCPPRTLPALVDVLRGAFTAFNVTIPYKEAILPFLQNIDDTARAMGAVNTVKIAQDGSMTGFSTDGAGFIYAMALADIPLHNQRVLLLGCGGTARTLAYELLKRGCTVSISARNTQRASALASEMHTATGGAIALLAQDDRATYDLLINTTPVGMSPHADACPADDALLARCKAVFDAIYNPRKTQLILRAEAMGLPALGGLSMLYGQAVQAHALWGMPTLPAQEHARIFAELEASIR